MADRDVGVRVEPPISEIRRSLRRVAPEANKQLSRDLKQIAEQEVAAPARVEAVRRTGRYAASIRTYAVKGGASVGSRLPQAGVLHWGGTIRPRGIPIVFPPRPVITDAVRRREDRIVERVGETFDDAAARAGWR